MQKTSDYQVKQGNKVVATIIDQVQVSTTIIYWSLNHGMS